MTNHPENNPDVYGAFMTGLQVSSNNPFGQIPVDQTIEVTVNKDTQSLGGTAWFSWKAGAKKQYYITDEHLSAFLLQLI